MEREERNDKCITRKRSFTFGAYGGVDKFTCESDKSNPDPLEEHSILDVLDSPTSESKPLPNTGNNQKVTELFEIIEKLQGSRLDEQRCEFPLPLRSQLLKIGGELPLILPPKLGGYWIDPPLETSNTSPTSSHYGTEPESYDIMERDSEAKNYQKFFRSRYHHTFTAVDPLLGALVLSVCLEEEEKRLRVILRMKECSLHGVFSLSLFPNIPSSVELAKMLCDNVTVSRFDVVSYLKAPDLITAFDEHRMSQNFKFGVLYQREGQWTEEDILHNNEETEDFQEFLSILGDTVMLQGFTGFRGGLDVCHGQTGSDAVFTSFRGREIMFHVSTKLPFIEGDAQQLQRKRHIGNDIVAVVYQEGNTPFLCDVISSHFLHCFVVVRRLKGEGKERRGAFQVSVTGREDVPPFGPALPDPPIFTDRFQLRDFLLTKLVNAEISCYKAERFSRLELRTRSSLLEGLQAELSSRSQCMMGDPTVSAFLSSEGVRGMPEGSGGFIENFKRAIRVRSHSFETLGGPRKIGGVPLSQKPKPATERNGESELSNKSPGTSFLPSDNQSSTEVKAHSSPQEDTRWQPSSIRSVKKVKAQEVNISRFLASYTGTAETNQRSKMANSRKVIELFYDVVSPYSWLGFEVMCRYRNVWNIDLKLRPAFLGGVMQGSGNKPPGVIPNKFLYMGKDLHRLAQYFRVPISPPADPVEAMFKKGSLTAMRFVTAVQERELGGDEQVEKVSRELWMRIWSQDKDITQPASLSEAAMKAGLSGSEVEEILKLSTSKQVKDKLKISTQEALDYGAFGFPLIVCHMNGKAEVFFGSDRFELIAHLLGEKWEGPEPSAAKLETMSSPCNSSLCEIRMYEQEVIIVPTLLLATFLVILVFIILMRFCPEKVERLQPQKVLSPSRPQRSRRQLHGIDAPPGINPLEHESIALEIHSSYSTFPPVHSQSSANNPAHAPGAHPLPFTALVQPRELPRQRLPESFNLVTPLPTAFSLRSDRPVSLYRARMDNRNAVLRVLKDSANATERHNFLGFASFLSQLGQHPFLPELLGVVSLRAPLVTVVEELENRDLLSFLWRCRQGGVGGDPPCELTERRIFTMAKQVASALEFLHSRDLIHGNICAHSVLVSRELTAKLWGLGGVYTRKTLGASQKIETGLKKWQAPELLVRRPASQSSDVWSFGILLYEMATLGEAPFSDISVNELLQFHQRGKTLKKPANCSNSLYSIIKTCCQWKEQDRTSLAEVSRKLQLGEKTASDKVLKVPEPIDIEQYLREAGYGDFNSYAVL
ncbi:hypothetical protein UPYG_G00153240 [Umbra pygmaea]|uniref:Glutathione S-transferase kappa 1 n=1 Tax=Umbra pygmaea TaxID=75934 RepID=A0ABD0WXP7_UMBPY